MNNLIDAELGMQALALAIARNNVGVKDPIATVLAKEFVSLLQYQMYQNDPLFVQAVATFEQELTEKGFSFITKNKVAAEDGIKDMYRLLKDDDTPAAVKVKIYENFVTNAQLVPKNMPVTEQTGTGFSINIVLPGQPPAAITNSRSPVTIDQPRHAAVHRTLTDAELEHYEGYED
jgi:hypothetical protein